MPLLAQWANTVRRLHWMRGIRAGIAVLAAMVVCHSLGKPMGWAALGGFEAILVDNGGPYRSRWTTMLTVLGGGAIACIVGSIAAAHLWLAVVATSLFCFAITFARVLSNQLASTSVIIMVLYFAGFGGSTHSVAGALSSALAYVLGGLWAAALSLFLWPVDPFRPARLGVANCYAILTDFTSEIHVTTPHSAERQLERHRMHELQRRMRLNMETARAAIGTTGARITARTLRAHSLTVLLETADILFAGTIRWTELLESTSDSQSQAAITDALIWLQKAERTVAEALRQRPSDEGASFAPEGSHSIEHLQKHAAAIRTLEGSTDPLIQHLLQDERDALLNIEVAFEAIRALWSGVEHRASAAGSAPRETRSLLSRPAEPTVDTGWRAMVEAARANWTLHSVMMRHALRMLIVGAIDVLVMRMVHISHGSWLGMTSIIVLQPSGSGTLRRGVQRVVGTVAGGVLAAIFAAGIHSQDGIIAVVTITSILTLATYAVDYAWYCFFLTPTFVLLSLPHLRDWHFAGVRIGMTLLGAAIAVLAMRLLWPEKDRMELRRLLARGALADAAYVRAMLSFWSALKDASSDADRIAADRRVLAPARRACGLAINDAEEALDRIMLEPRVPLASGGRWEEALTFVTYLRRMTRAVTTLASLGSDDADCRARAGEVARRMVAVGDALETLQQRQLASAIEDQASGEAATRQSVTAEEETPAKHQLRRLERQTGVMERTAQVLVQQSS